MTQQKYVNFKQSDDPNVHINSGYSVVQRGTATFSGLKLLVTMFSKIILTCLLVGVVLAKSSILYGCKDKGKCRTLCPEIRLELNMTSEDVTLKNIALNAPVDCICLEKSVPNKWMMRGNAYNVCDRPVCLAQPIGKNIKRNEGEECPPILIAKSTETMFQYWTRIHDEQKDAPSDGWCPPGTQKWIVYGKEIGQERDTCTCVNDFYWMEK